VTAAGGPLIIGGLDSSGESVAGVFRLDSATGRVREEATLSAPLHDAAAVRLGDRVLVFGGGTATSTDAVQALPDPGGGRVAPTTPAEVAGRLPSPRSDLSAVVLNGRAYVLGGYDGSRTDASVLETSDGATFASVANLPVPGRYIAVAALDGRIFAFGGESVDERPSDAIQEIDPGAGSARIVGHLPVPLSHASAIALGGSIYVLGGDAEGSPTAAIWRFEPGRRGVRRAGRLPLPVADAAVAAVGDGGFLVGGMGASGAPRSTIVTLALRRTAASGRAATAEAPPQVSPPFRGRLLIADRGNDRLLLVGADRRIHWLFPSRRHRAPPGGFYFPDDAFFTHHGTALIANEEQNERIVQLAFPSGKLLWSYGHPGVSGSEHGYLHEPDDAYLLRDGTVSVADAQNCRVMLISHAKRVLRSFGSPTACAHEPPRYLGSPNGDTPLRNGNFLISEVNGSYIDELTPRGKLVWSLQLPISYPSDPQQLGPDRYLVADYARPGGIYEFNRSGRVFWSYHPSSGRGMLDHPSLAERLPTGLIAVNDDYRDRVVLIDPHTHRIVWQYGHTDEPGTRPGFLNTPDGFDLLAPNGTTPTHPYTG
jgi:hypothetical protein